MTACVTNVGIVLAIPLTGLASCVDDIWTTAIVLVGKMAEGVAAGAPQMVQAISTTVTDILECLV